MNCNTCRYELSQCLDGRLPSGRRAVVLDHAESCESCGQFWEELQAAQNLTLSLKPTEVGHQFREGLWERIHAGEGTPDAVFHEPVAIWTKVRYGLTGAAAAAALLIGVTFLQKDDPAPSTGHDIARSNPNVDGGTMQPRPHETLASNDRGPGGLQPRQPVRSASPALTSNPLFSNAQPLTMQVLAREAANQLEQRYHEASIGMRMMRDPDSNRVAAVRRVIDNASELRDFGELLIDLRERERLFIRDADLQRDLDFAVTWLERVPSLSEHAPEEDIERFYGPALERRRLANVTKYIGLPVASDPQREQLELKELNTRRPEVFPKLFVVFGDMSDLHGSMTTILPNMKVVESSCGPSWVAPRSEVVRHDTLLRMFGEQGQVTFEIEVHEGR
jgi:hypothetical protein